MQISIKSDGKLETFANNLGKAPSWMPTIVKNRMGDLRVVGMSEMKNAVSGNRYSGALEDSIVGVLSDEGYTLTVNPTALRNNKWDAGVLLEKGVNHPIPNLPWMPIMKWATFRGIPAVPVWLSMRAHGVKAHPFLKRTLEAVKPELKVAVKGMLDDASGEIIAGMQ